MRSLVAFLLLALLGSAAVLAQYFSIQAENKASNTTNNIANNIANNIERPPMAQQTTASAPVVTTQVRAAVEKGAKWLASVQGADGGWGQDGGAPSHNRQNVHLESQGNDVANTAVAALALLRAGDQYRPNVERAVNFILQKVEASPADGLSITDVNQTQIQMKLGPYIDTFLASMLLAQVDGTLTSANARVRRGLEKCVAKIERNQMSDGSWNVGGGWAPLLGTSLASRSLFEASKKGVKTDRAVMARADEYTINNQKNAGSATGVAGGVVASMGGGSSYAGGGSGRRLSGAIETSTSLAMAPGAAPAAAGVRLYQDAQALEQLSRSETDRVKNAAEIAAISSRLSDEKFVAGFGSIGGEEFFSYLNISDSLKRTGGKEWSDWHSKMTDKILKLQNSDGTWAGHHCITGRVAVTSAAILNLVPDREN
jgi:Squalene-hopene cyclase C-terminal domain/Prenyltransferase and squalene oxidase repeat